MAHESSDDTGPRLERTSGLSAWGWALLAVAALLLVGVLVWRVAPVQRWAQTVFEVDQSTGPDRGINVNEVAHSTDRLIGKRVTVSAVLDRVLTPHSAVIGREGLRVTSGGEDEILVVAGADQLLVLSAAPLTSRVSEGMAVQVTGTVHRFPPDDRQAIERELGVPLDERTIPDDVDASGTIVATSVRPAPPTSKPGDKEDPGSTDGPERGVDINAIVHDPPAYLGRTVTVSGEVETKLSDQALLLSDDKLLVVMADFPPDVMEEATAFVTGTVHSFNLVDVERALGIDLDDRALAEREGQPVILAESIRMVR
jgi:hypothetical protein